MQWPLSEGRRFADLDLGRIAQSTPRRHFGGGRARQSTSEHQEETAANAAFRKVSKSSSLKAL